MTKRPMSLVNVIALALLVFKYLVTKGGSIAMNISRKPLIIILLFSQAALGGNVHRYTDGPLTQYLREPLPDLNKPLARSLSVEQVQYNTAGGMKGTMIGDSLAREIYILPDKTGRKVDTLLKMDDEFSEEATLAALNTIAENRSEARHMWSGKKPQLQTVSNPTSHSDAQYIKREERLAKAAYSKGDYLTGQIHTSAAMNRIEIDRSFAAAESTANMAAAVLNAGAAAGEALVKKDFNKLHKWLEQDSGAISPTAPEGTHLSMFFLQYVDGKRFRRESRMRVAVYLALTDEHGTTTTVLAGSDLLACKGKCALYKLKPTARLVDKAKQSSDIQNLYGTKEGFNTVAATGLPYTSADLYVLLKHGLVKLAAATNKKR